MKERLIRKRKKKKDINISWIMYERYMCVLGPDWRSEGKFIDVDSRLSLIWASSSGGWTWRECFSFLSSSSSSFILREKRRGEGQRGNRLGDGTSFATKRACPGGELATRAGLQRVGRGGGRPQCSPAPWNFFQKKPRVVFKIYIFSTTTPSSNLYYIHTTSNLWIFIVNPHTNLLSEYHISQKKEKKTSRKYQNFQLSIQAAMSYTSQIYVTWRWLIPWRA